MCHVGIGVEVVTLIAHHMRLYCFHWTSVLPKLTVRLKKRAKIENPTLLVGSFQPIFLHQRTSFLGDGWGIQGIQQAVQILLAKISLTHQKSYQTSHARMFEEKWLTQTASISH